jgi:hypothetical protein
MDSNRVYLELTLQKSIETDRNGNFVIWAEASNENLDFQEQVVLQDALTKSKDYFLKNGVISYDHRHLHEKDNPEKYWIGEPLDVVQKGKKTFVKALLYKSNEIAREIVNKLQDGSTRIKTSIGGKLPKVVKAVDDSGKLIEKVVSVLWDELAITYKPVNQTLSPIALSSAAFVKALTAGTGTDSASLTGGGALRMQDLEGVKKNVNGVLMAISYGDISKEEEIRGYLKDRGLLDHEIDQIIEYMVEHKEKLLKGVGKMGAELMKALDDSIEELEKAMKKSSKKEEDYPDPEKDVDDPEVVEEDEDEEEEEDEMEKSLYEEVAEDAGEFLDVSDFLKSLTLGISRRFRELEGEIRKSQKTQNMIAKSMLASSKMLKSIGDQPMSRQSVLAKSERKFVGNDGEQVSMGRGEILAKANQAMKDGKIDYVAVSKIEDRLNKGQPIDDNTMRMLKAM